MFLRKGIRLTWLAAAILCAFPSFVTAQQKSRPPAEPVNNQLRSPAADSTPTAPSLPKTAVSQTAVSQRAVCTEARPQQESITNNPSLEPQPQEPRPSKTKTSQAAGTNQLVPNLARTRQASAPAAVRTASQSIRSLPNIEETPAHPAMAQEDLSPPSKKIDCLLYTSPSPRDS